MQSKLLTTPRPLVTRSRTDFVLTILLVVSVILSAVFILKDSGRVPPFPMDQSYVESADLRLYREAGRWVFHYPAIQNSSGITSSLLAGIYKLLIPTSPSTLNWHFRIFSMLLYLGSSCLLVRAFIQDGWTRLLVFMVIATSGYQFIQPSSELIAATLLSLAFLALRSSWPLPVAAFFLAGFGLCKVELSIAAVAIAFFWALWGYRRGHGKDWMILPFTVAWMAFFLLPGFVVEGGSPFSGNRSYLAFIYTYAEIFMPHQFNAASGFPLEKGVELVRQNILGAEKSLPLIILKHPMVYADFLALQTVRSLVGTIDGLKLMILPFILVVTRQAKVSSVRPYLFAALIAIVFTLGPAWLIAYVRLRYWVKLFPVVLVLAAAGCLLLDPNQKRSMRLLWICGVGTIVWQLIDLPNVWKYSHYQ